MGFPLPDALRFQRDIDVLTKNDGRTFEFVPGHSKLGVFRAFRRADSPDLLWLRRRSVRAYAKYLRLRRLGISDLDVFNGWDQYLTPPAPLECGALLAQ